MSSLGFCGGFTSVLTLESRCRSVLLCLSAVCVVAVQMHVVCAAQSLSLVRQTSGKGNIDSLLSLLSRLKEGDTVRTRLMIEIAVAQLESKGEGSVMAAQQALQSAQQHASPALEAAAYSVLGQAYWYRGEYALSLNAHRKALAYWQSIQDKASEARTLYDIAQVYRSRDEYGEAMKRFFTVLDMSKVLKDTVLLSQAFASIGEIAMRQNDTTKAQEAIQMAISLQTARNDKRNLATTLTIAGELAMKSNDFSTALQHYAAALGAQLAMNLKQSMSSTLGSMGEAYIRQQEFDAALESFHRSLALSREQNDQQGTAAALNRLGELHIVLRKYDSASLYLKAGLDAATSIGARDIQLRSYLSMGRLDSARGNFASALTLFSKAALLKDSLFGAQQARQLAELRAQHQLEERDREIQSLERENVAQARFRNVLLVLIVLAVIAVLVVVSSYRLIRQKNAEITKQSQLLAIKNTELQQANYEYEYTVERVFELNQQLAKQNEETTKLKEQLIALQAEQRDK